MKKRGQVTLFIVIAISIVIAGLIGWFVYRSHSRTKTLSEEIALAKNFLQERLAYEVDGALLLLGLQGGYSEKSEKFLQMQFHFIPYYYYNKKVIVPSSNRVKEEIKKEITERILAIESNFSRFELQVSDPKIELNNLIKVAIPVKMKKGEEQTLFEVYYERKNIDFDKMLNISKTIAENVRADPGKINLELLLNLQKNHSIIISPLIFDENTIIYRIADNSTMIDNRIWEFYFAVENE
ncbi:MAG: hypothetical protein QXQ82_01870 [Candidatus Pacearchaeota archaeon]